MNKDEEVHYYFMLVGYCQILAYALENSGMNHRTHPLVRAVSRKALSTELITASTPVKVCNEPQPCQPVTDHSAQCAFSATHNIEEIITAVFMAREHPSVHHPLSTTTGEQLSLPPNANLAVQPRHLTAPVSDAHCPLMTPARKTAHR